MVVDGVRDGGARRVQREFESSGVIDHSGRVTGDIHDAVTDARPGAEFHVDDDRDAECIHS